MQSEHNEQLTGTQTEIDQLRAQIKAFQIQATELHKARKNNTCTYNHELISKVKVLKNMMNEHSKLFEQSVKKLSQIKGKNLVIRE